MKIVKRSCLALAALAASSLITGALAAPPVNGRWQGPLETNGSMPSQISVALAVLSPQQSTLRFSAPWSCQLELTFLGESGGNAAYSLDSKNGGAACDRQLGGRAYLSTGADGRVSLTITSPRVSYRALLSRQPN